MARPQSPDSSGPDLRPFLYGLPTLYGERHPDHEVRVHARLSMERGRSGARVVVDHCPGPPTEPGAQWLCVVADDQPGLLSLLSAALTAHSLDILGARVYSRERAGRVAEAIDLFCVRPLKRPDGTTGPAPDLGAIRRSIDSLLRGDTDVATLEKHAAKTSRPPHGPATAVYFAEVPEADVLVVETRDRPGLLLSITLALHRAGTSVLRSSVTTFAGVARDEFEVVHVSGGSLSPTLRGHLVARVLEAVETR